MHTDLDILAIRLDIMHSNASHSHAHIYLYATEARKLTMPKHCTAVMAPPYLLTTTKQIGASLV